MFAQQPCRRHLDKLGEFVEPHAEVSRRAERVQTHYFAQEQNTGLPTLHR